MTTSIHPQDILYRAAELARDFGWTQGHMYADANGDKCRPEQAAGACLLGLISMAAAELASDREPAARAKSQAIAIGMLNATLGQPVVRFNDDPATTAAAAEQALRRAAATPNPLTGALAA